MEYFEHGGNNKVDFDYSVNLNPLGIKQSISSNIQNVLLNRFLLSSYPSVDNRESIKIIADYHNIGENNVVIGSGVSELIMRCVSTLPLKKALLIAPTFSEYERCLSVNNIEFDYHNLDEENDFNLDESILPKLDKNIDALFLTNPSNPVGNLVSRELIEKIIDRCNTNSIYLIIDEAFLPFTNEKSSIELIDKSKYLIVLRSLTKMYCIAGIRVGYLVLSNDEIKKALDNAAPTWALSALAISVLPECFNDGEYESRTRALIKKERAVLEKALKSYHLKTYGGVAPFILFKADDDNLVKKLLNYSIAIRDCSNYNNLSKGFYRIAVKDSTTNSILISVLRTIL